MRLALFETTDLPASKRSGLADFVSKMGTGNDVAGVLSAIVK